MSNYLPFAPIKRLTWGEENSSIVCLRTISDSAPWQFNELKKGALSLALFGIKDAWLETPPIVHSSYNFLMKDVMVSSEGGLIMTKEGVVIADTMDHTLPELELYRRSGDGTIALPAPEGRLVGCWLSLLLGNQENYFHFLLMNLSRLSQINSEERGIINGILLPSTLTAAEWQAVEMALHQVFKNRTMRVKKINKGESLKIERLFLPWNVVNTQGYSHKTALSFLRKMALTDHQNTLPSLRIYIDRREGTNRILLNEEALIDALKSFDFVPVSLEKLSFKEQVALFSQSTYIVAPHGAGLANLAFAAPGTKVLEIMPDTLLNWCYRHLAAMNALSYDCILSRSINRNKAEATIASHCVSVGHVISALDL